MLQPQNAVCIPSWYSDKADKNLLNIIAPLLKLSTLEKPLDHIYMVNEALEGTNLASPPFVKISKFSRPFFPIQVSFPSSSSSFASPSPSTALELGHDVVARINEENNSQPVSLAHIGTIESN